MNVNSEHDQIVVNMKTYILIGALFLLRTFFATCRAFGFHAVLVARDRARFPQLFEKSRLWVLERLEDIPRALIRCEEAQSMRWFYSR